MKTAQLITYYSTHDAIISRGKPGKTYVNISRASYTRLYKLIHSRKHEGYFTPLYSCIFIIPEG
jgi:hypothetical protein